MMTGLTPMLLGRACRIFLSLAYPEGKATIPPSKAAYLDLAGHESLDRLLAPPLCQPITNSKGGVRGYALRLGSADFPHVKLQVTDCGPEGGLVFAVDTHDALSLDPDHPDAPRWAAIQAANRVLKEKIERAWEAEGLMTFNALLRRGLKKCDGS